MLAIRHRVGIAAPAAEVYEALSTPQGLARWWTRDVKGDAGVGGELTFTFGGPSVTMEVIELDLERRVAWRCVSPPEEWTGTKISFELSDGEQGETVVLFEHAEWREPVAFMHHCSTKWAYFLISLKRSVEGGRATPHPDDERISSWG